MANNHYAPPYTSSKRRALTTPEGVDLTIEIASFGARIAAFVIDIAILYGSLILLWLALSFMASGKLDEPARQFLNAFWLVLLFVMRNFWFILFEMSARGATLGKRLLGLRVVARDGGRLDASSVVARNLMRDVEVFLPLVFIISMIAASASASWVTTTYALLGTGWTLIFMLFPLFNRDRMRAGDLLGGTWVIRAPRTRMAADLNEASRTYRQYFTFSPEQIAVYGAYELQTLESLLRGKDTKSLDIVAATIRHKIGWPDGDDDRAFLQAYYAAVRGQLEKNMLFGKKRRDKYDTE